MHQTKEAEVFLRGAGTKACFGQSRLKRRKNHAVSQHSLVRQGLGRPRCQDGRLQTAIRDPAWRALARRWRFLALGRSVFSDGPFAGLFRMRTMVGSGVWSEDTCRDFAASAPDSCIPTSLSSVFMSCALRRQVGRS